MPKFSLPLDASETLCELMDSTTGVDALRLFMAYSLPFTDHEEGGYILRRADQRGRYVHAFVPVPVAAGTSFDAYEPSDLSVVFELEDRGFLRIASVHNHSMWPAIPSVTDRNHLFREHQLNFIYSNPDAEVCVFDRNSQKLEFSRCCASLSMRYLKSF